MNITIVGSGYVGLVTGASLASLGNNVVCLDTNKETITNLDEGVLPFFEPGLKEIISGAKQRNLISFTSDKKKAFSFGEIIFVCVPTPQKESGEVNLEYVYSVAKEIGEHISNYAVIVTKSTVPVTTGDKVEELIKKELSERKLVLGFDVVSNPEFLAEGSAIKNFLEPSRICVGVSSEKAKKLMLELYSPLTSKGVPILVMDRKSAELSKYACNAMLATRISFVNQFANLAEKIGADIESIRRVMQLDPRIGDKFLYPGIGYGGSCFPKDVRGVLSTSKEFGAELTILGRVDEANTKQKTVLLKKIIDYYKNDLVGKRIAVWGLSFKKNTSDMRESPAIPIIWGLVKEKAVISAFDPEAVSEAKHVFSNKISYANSKEKALIGCECLLVLTDWDEFRETNYQLLREHGIKVVFDGRNLLEPNKVREQGVTYFGIGRK